MNTRAVLLAVMLGSLGNGCEPQHATVLSVRHAAAMRDSLRTTLEAFRRATDGRQWDSVAAMYADDSTFRWIEDGRVVARSAAEIRQHLRATPPSVSIRTSYDSVEYLPTAPGVGGLTTQYRTTVRDSSGKGYTFGGILSLTLVHETGGWRILTGHTSSPRAPSGS